MLRSKKEGYCKKHNKKLIEVYGYGGYHTGEYQCLDCKDNIDFYLPLPMVIISIVWTGYNIISPPFEGVRWIWIFLFGGITLFFTMGSSIRVLKRLIIQTNG